MGKDKGNPIDVDGTMNPRLGGYLSMMHDADFFEPPLRVLPVPTTVGAIRLVWWLQEIQQQLHWRKMQRGHSSQGETKIGFSSKGISASMCDSWVEKLQLEKKI